MAAIAALATVAGGAAIVLPSRLSERVLSHIIAFGAGFMLAAAFLRMVPESMALVSSAPMWVLIGYILAHLFEHTFTPHFHFGEETHEEHMINPGVSVSAFVGLALHAVFDGISISSGFLVSSSLGFVIALAVILHKIPEGVTISSVMIASGRPRRVALNSSIALGAATLFGAIGMIELEMFKGYALAMSAGIATYVAATDLIPELNKLKEMEYSLSAAIGVVFFFLIGLLMSGAGLH